MSVARVFEGLVSDATTILINPLVYGTFSRIFFLSKKENSFNESVEQDREENIDESLACDLCPKSFRVVDKLGDQSIDQF